MKNSLITTVLVMVISLGTMGCSLTGGTNVNWQDNIPKLQADISMFSKVATRIALSEAEMPSEDKQVIESYLIALRDFLQVPGQPNFDGARVLVTTNLPPQYKIYGLTVIDVIERYVSTLNINVTEDQEDLIALISSAIDGALSALQDF